MTKFIDMHGFAVKEHAMPAPRKRDGKLIHPQCTAEELIGFYDQLGIEIVGLDPICGTCSARWTSGY